MINTKGRYQFKVQIKDMQGFVLLPS